LLAKNRRALRRSVWGLQFGVAHIQLRQLALGPGLGVLVMTNYLWGERLLPSHYCDRNIFRCFLFAYRLSEGSSEA
jgi:hypothetical protein